MAGFIKRLFDCTKEAEDQGKLVVREVPDVAMHACIDLCMVLLVTEIRYCAAGSKVEEDLLVILRVVVLLHQVFFGKFADHLGYSALGDPQQSRQVREIDVRVFPDCHEGVDLGAVEHVAGSEVFRGFLVGIHLVEDTNPCF